MRLIDKVTLLLITLVIALTLSCFTVKVDGAALPDHPASVVVSQASGSSDGLVKFVGTYQNHLLRFEHSQRSDNQPKTILYELILSWCTQGILLLLLGWLILAAQIYHKQSFRDRFGAIHRRTLQRQHLQYRFSQSYLTA